LLDRPDAGLHRRDGITGVPRGVGNQRALRSIVIDDQKLQRAPLAAVWRAWLDRR
jgi:hypothetical protein